MPRKRTPIDEQSASTRSAVTNGRRTFVEGDGRGPWARRWRDLVSLHTDDIGRGADLSEAQASLVRRAATIEIELEQLEGKLSMGEEVDLDAYARVSGHLRRILETLGIDRKSKDVTPDLRDYLRGAPAGGANMKAGSAAASPARSGTR